MNWQQAFDAFDLDDETAGDDAVDAVPAVQSYAFVGDGDRELSFERDAVYRELVADALLMGRYQKPRSEMTVYFDERTDDLLGELGESSNRAAPSATIRRPKLRCRNWPARGL